MCLQRVPRRFYILDLQLVGSTAICRRLLLHLQILNVAAVPSSRINCLMCIWNLSSRSVGENLSAHLLSHLSLSCRPAGSNRSSHLWLRRRKRKKSSASQTDEPKNPKTSVYEVSALALAPWLPCTLVFSPTPLHPCDLPHTLAPVRTLPPVGGVPHS